MAKTNKQHTQVGGGYHRPVCPECETEMRPEKNGVGVLDHADFGLYALYDADLWKCPKCGKRVIGGFGYGAASRHYDEDFERMVEYYRDQNKLYNNYAYVEKLIQEMEGINADKRTN